MSSNAPSVRSHSIEKNALFAGSDGGAENWAIVASLIETCKLNGVDPQAWMVNTLTKIVRAIPTARSTTSCRGPTHHRSRSSAWPDNSAYDQVSLGQFFAISESKAFLKRASHSLNIAAVISSRSVMCAISTGTIMNNSTPSALTIAIRA